MKTKQNYWYRLVEAFYNFTLAENRITKSELITILRLTEEEERELHGTESNDECLWIRFGKNSISYTINNIDVDLDLQKSTRKNYEFLFEQMKESTTSDPDYLEIYFS
jgi:hypothetical protein